MSGETESEPFGWSFDTLYRHFNALRDEDQKALQAALAAQEKALTAAFLAAEKAVAAALVAQEKAVDAALQAQEKAVAAAMAASDKQINRADVATEKRFDSVNEFRAQQADLIARFMPRAEAIAIVASNTDRIHAVNAGMDRRLDDLRVEFDKLDKRMDLAQGRSGGLQSSWGYLVAAIGAMVLLVNLGIYAFTQ